MRKKLETAKKELETLPQGSLRCTSSNGTDQFYIDGHYISKKKVELVTKVAQREYYEKLVPVLEDAIQKLSGVVAFYDNHMMEKCFDKQCKARKQLVTPSIQSIDMKVEAFMKQTYEPSGFSDEDMTEFYTHKGERVRSKSELIIAGELNRYDVPYHYEMPLQLNDWGRVVALRPDFTVMNRSNGKRYIYEHLGMMDNQAYVESNMKKLELYEKNGFLLGKNLLVTHETSKSPLNIAVVDSYIEHYLI